MSWFSPKVKVTFIDDSTGKAFAVSEIPPSDLPESFVIDTTLHLGPEDWSVVDAQPNNRTEYARSKSLVLRLRRIQKLDPRDILFSLPTICDAIPHISEQVVTGNEFVLAEDDWRQFEFVSCSLSDEVDDEIGQIRLIHEQASTGSGWRKLHVRKKPVSPIASAVRLDDLVLALGMDTTLSRIAYRDSRNLIADGFAFRSTGPTLYGIAPQRLVQTIAFDPYSGVSFDPESLTRLKTFARDRQLELVDWCRCARVSPDNSDFDALLRNRA